MKLEKEQLLAISEDIHHRFAPKNQTQATSLTLLPVDPFHAYLYCPQPPAMKAMDTAWRLQIYCSPDMPVSATGQATLWLDSVMTDWPEYLHLPMPVDNSYYHAIIGIDDHQQGFLPVYRSNHIDVPRAKPPLSLNHVWPERPVFYDQAQIDTLIQRLIESTGSYLSQHQQSPGIEQTLPEMVQQGWRYQRSPPNVYQSLERLSCGLSSSQLG
ncbi:MAG: hypothetical protein RQ715_10995 [Methylococcales bacterium]|nr:hypothetical protein [Methylococcales bacterium]